MVWVSLVSCSRRARVRAGCQSGRAYRYPPTTLRRGVGLAAGPPHESYSGDENIGGGRGLQVGAEGRGGMGQGLCAECGPLLLPPVETRPPGFTTIARKRREDEGSPTRTAPAQTDKPRQGEAGPGAARGLGPLTGEGAGGLAR